MRAIVVHEHGGPEVLRLEEVDVPQPAADEVLVRVAVATVNFADVKARRGEEPNLPFIPGHDAVGVVEAVGADVRSVAVGARVGVILWRGTYAELVTAPERHVVPIPESLGTREASGLVALSTAYNVLTVAGGLRIGETVVVHAAAGGVGSAAVQIAAALGARRVIGAIRSPEKADTVERLGGVPVVTDYGPDHADRVRTAAGGDIDLVVDSVGGRAVSGALKALRPFGRVVVFGHTSGEAACPSTRSIQSASLTLRGYRGRDYLREQPDVVVAGAQAGLALLSRGAVQVPSGGTFELGDAPAAHALLEGGTSTGKLSFAVSLGALLDN